MKHLGNKSIHFESYNVNVSFEIVKTWIGKGLRMQIQTSEVSSNVKYGHEKAVSKESHVRVASLQWYGFCYLYQFGLKILLNS
jgi:hypothetical protein